MNQWQGAKIGPTLSVVVLGLALWFVPVPVGLSVQAWHLFVIFISTIFAIIARPLPIGAVALIGMTACIITETLTLKESLTAFAHPIVWLIVMAFLIARGFIKTGLGERIAYNFIARFGQTTLGLTYSLVFSEFLLAPATPSNTARGGGVIYPIARSLAESFDSHPQDTSRNKLGRYLMNVCYQSNGLTSVMFLTAMASNPLCASLASQAGVNIDWFLWTKAAIVPGLITLIAMPYLIYKIYPPTIKNTHNAPEQAREALAKKGPLSRQEGTLLVTFIVLLTLWIFGSQFGVATTTAAMIGLSLLLLSGVLSWDDIQHEKGAWSTLIWFATLLMMASKLNEYGMMSWFAQIVQSHIAGISWPVTLLIVCALFYYAHYFFANVTSHVSALYSAFLVVAISAGTPPIIAALALAYCSSMSCALTHYGTGSAPIYYGSGYVNVREWWTVGFAVSLMSFIIWTTIGTLWWKTLGLF